MRRETDLSISRGYQEKLEQMRRNGGKLPSDTKAITKSKGRALSKLKK